MHLRTRINGSEHPTFPPSASASQDTLNKFSIRKSESAETRSWVGVSSWAAARANIVEILINIVAILVELSTARGTLYNHRQRKSAPSTSSRTFRFRYFFIPFVNPTPRATSVRFKKYFSILLSWFFAEQRNLQNNEKYILWNTFTRPIEQSREHNFSLQLRTYS